MSDLIKAYMNYRSERARFKAQLRQELTTLLRPASVRLGAAMEAERLSGARVEDILGTLGLKNRTEYYTHHNAYLNRAVQSTEDTPVPEVKPVTYTITDFRDSIPPFIDIVFSDEKMTTYVVEVNPDGSLEPPEYWLSETDPERKKLYREILNGTGT